MLPSCLVIDIDPPSRVCIACGAHGARARRFRDGPYILATCDRCSLRWVVNAPQGEELAALYSSGFYEPGPERANGVVELYHHVDNTFRMRELRGLRPGRLLDVGSGRGRFLAAASTIGWDAVGIEFEPGLAAMASDRYGVEVVVGDAVSAPVEGPFDVITMWHALEHLPDPLAALERARELLAPGGRLVISVPNNDSWQARLGGDDWLHLDIPRHLYHFTPGSLTRLVERAGGDVVRLSYLYPGMEVLGVLQTALIRMGIAPVLLYRCATRDRTVAMGPDVLLSLAAAAAFMPVALSAAVITPLVRSGASMQLMAARAG